MIYLDEILAQILGEKKIKIIKLICQNADENMLVRLKIDEICNLTNSSKPTVIETIKLLETKHSLLKIKNGLYKLNIQKLKK